MHGIRASFGVLGALDRAAATENAKQYKLKMSKT